MAKKMKKYFHDGYATYYIENILHKTLNKILQEQERPFALF